MKNSLNSLRVFFLIVSLGFSACAQSTTQRSAAEYQVVYKGDKGPGVGKNIVFIATDHEYRGEESLPALARILAAAGTAAV